MVSSVQRRLKAATLFAAPLVLLTGIASHPYLVDEFDVPAMAAEVSVDPGRWAWVHVVLIVAFALISLAVVVVRGMLRDAGEDRWSFFAVPLLVGGSVIFASIWGLEITVAAVANVGGDVEAVFTESDRWFGPLGIVGFGMSFIGWGILAFAVRRSGILGQRLTWLVLVATVVMLAGFLWPATGGGYLYSIGMIGFTWTLGYRAMKSVAVSPAEPLVERKPSS